MTPTQYHTRYAEAQDLMAKLAQLKPSPSSVYLITLIHEAVHKLMFTEEKVELTSLRQRLSTIFNPK